MGFSNFIHGTVASKTQTSVTVRAEGKEVRILCADTESFLEGEPVVVTIRPENISVDAEGLAKENAYAGTITSLIYKGTTTRLEVSGSFQAPLFVNLHGDAALQIGQNVSVVLEFDKLRIFKKQ